MIYNRFYSGKSEVDKCTLFSDSTVINRRNMTTETKDTYRANRDFLTIVLKSRVIAAAMKVLSIQEKSEPPSNHQQKYDYLINVSTAIVDEFIFQQGHVDQVVNSVLLEQEREDRVNNQQLT